MFLKPYKVKSQTAIKGSDRKKLRADLGRQFPTVDEAELKCLVPNKEEMSVMKIYTHAGQNVIVYFLQKNPIFFHLEGKNYPTVYTMWHHTDLLPVFITWPPVLSKIINGADLMLPGVVIPGGGGVTPAILGNLLKGTPCSVKLVGNKCPVAVGQTAMSSTDMYESNMRGKGVTVFHCYQDHLWASGDKSDPPLIEDPLPLPGSESSDGEESGDSDMENNKSLVTEPVTSEEPAATDGSEDLTANIERLSLEGKTSDEEACVNNQSHEEVGEEDGPSLQEVKEQMDELLYHCFLCALKLKVKKADLPLLTSKFLKVHLQPCCPKGKSLDLKKSSHKKLSKFLDAMQKEGFIRVKELSKGVDSIVEVQRDHPELREFKAELPEEDETDGIDIDGAKGTHQPPRIIEMFMITANTLPLFRPAGFNKGKALTAQQLRQVLIDYVKANELQEPMNKNYVRLDPILTDIAVNKNEDIPRLKWEELFVRCQSKMSPAHQVSFPGHAPAVKKGKLGPIVINVAQRSGNKKVTLVENLETYGIEPDEFGHQVQIGVACSASVSALPGKNRGSQVLIQGNQVNYVADLLVDKYQVPRKYIQGLEKAPKSGKKKR